ncbi:hypothetical protein FA10DRAFT_302283 [Acaromyces ingoldii]|uniref:Uncharacterized protein n=1 Tax=Acaromyces ingoldii TaxID=215250 RepID=A0A316YIH5_9BASI|nr:hypothetical protein FA10DRAFT_302283 [Acaromyces ingoldii]PWN88876.1 hypothetical protein FA10DRAFT_302283 [Acaromyces ingoldii]
MPLLSQPWASPEGSSSRLVGAAWDLPAGVAESAARAVSFVGPLSLGAIAWEFVCIDIAAFLSITLFPRRLWSRSQTQSSPRLFYATAAFGCIARAAALACISIYLAYTHGDRQVDCQTWAHAVAATAAVFEPPRQSPSSEEESELAIALHAHLGWWFTFLCVLLAGTVLAFLESSAILKFVYLPVSVALCPLICRKLWSKDDANVLSTGESKRSPVNSINDGREPRRGVMLQEACDQLQWWTASSPPPTQWISGGGVAGREGVGPSSRPHTASSGATGTAASNNSTRGKKLVHHLSGKSLRNQVMRIVADNAATGEHLHAPVAVCSPTSSSGRRTSTSSGMAKAGSAKYKHRVSPMASSIATTYSTTGTGSPQGEDRVMQDITNVSTGSLFYPYTSVEKPKSPLRASTFGDDAQQLPSSTQTQYVVGGLGPSPRGARSKSARKGLQQHKRSNSEGDPLPLPLENSIRTDSSGLAVRSDVVLTPHTELSEPSLSDSASRSSNSPLARVATGARRDETVVRKTSVDEINVLLDAIEDAIGEGTTSSKTTSQEQHLDRSEAHMDDELSDDEDDSGLKILRQAKEGASINLSHEAEPSSEEELRPSWAQDDKRKAKEKEHNEALKTGIEAVDTDVLHEFIDARGFPQSKSSDTGVPRSSDELFAKKLAILSEHIDETQHHRRGSNAHTEASFGLGDIADNPRLKTVLAMGSQPRQNPFKSPASPYVRRKSSNGVSSRTSEGSSGAISSPNSLSKSSSSSLGKRREGLGSQGKREKLLLRSRSNSKTTIASTSTSSTSGASAPSETIGSVVGLGERGGYTRSPHPLDVEQDLQAGEEADEVVSGEEELSKVMGDAGNESESKKKTQSEPSDEAEITAKSKSRNERGSRGSYSSSRSMAPKHSGSSSKMSAGVKQGEGQASKQNKQQTQCSSTSCDTNDTFGGRL